MSNGIIRVTLSDGTTPPDYLEYGISLDSEILPENSQLSNEFVGLDNAVYYVFYRKIGENWDPDNFISKAVDFPISYVALKIDEILEAVDDAQSATTIAIEARDASSNIFNNLRNVAIVTPVKNLFNINASDVLLGSYVLFSDGSTQVNSSYNATGFIDVLPNTQYTLSYKNQISYYDSSKTYISGDNNNISLNNVTITTPANCFFIRCSVNLASWNTFQVEQGNSATAFEEYYLKSVFKFVADKLTEQEKNNIINGLIIGNANLLDNSILAKKMSYLALIPSKNLFNSNVSDVVLGRYVLFSDGSTQVNSSYNATGFIAVLPNTQYTLSFKHQIAYYNSSKVYISGDNNNNGQNNVTITTPTDCFFIRCSVNLASWNTFQVEQGSTATAFEAYSEKYLFNNLRLSDVNFSDIVLSGNRIADNSMSGDKIQNSSISGNKIADSSINPTNLNFFTILPSKNLFNSNASDVVLGRYVLFSDGSTQVNSSYNATGFIAVLPNTQYTLSYKNQIAYYNSSKTYISGDDTNISLNNVTITTPANCFFIRCSVNLASWNTFQVEQGSTATAFEAYSEKYSFNNLRLNDVNFSDFLLSGNRVADNSIEPKKLNFFTVLPSKNLFNINASDVVLGRYVLFSDGSTQVNSSYNATGFIDVLPNTQYTLSFKHQIAYYNSSKTYISGNSNNNGQNNVTITTPANCFFIRCSVNLASWNTFQVEQGSTATAFEDYSPKIFSSQLRIAWNNILNAPTFSQLQNEIAMPSILYMLDNVQFDLFYEPIVKRWRPERYDIRPSGTASYSRNFKRLITILSAIDSSTVTLSLIDSDDFSSISQKTSVIKLGQKGIGTNNIFVQFLGDSYTNGAFFRDAIFDKGYCPNVTTVGLRDINGKTGNFDEGRGGWTLAKYFSVTTSRTDSHNPYWQPNSARYWGSTAFWKLANDIRINPNAAYSFDESYNASRYNTNCQRFSSSTGYILNPVNNDVMFDNNLGYYVLYNGSAWIQANYNDYSWSFDYSKYLSMWGLTPPTFLFVLLGLNDFRDASNPENISFTMFNSNLQSLITSYLAAVPTGRIGIGLPTSTCGQIDGDGNYTTKQNASMWMCRKNIITNFDNRSSERIYLIDAGIMVDSINGYNFSTDANRIKPFGVYSGTTTLNIQSGQPHPFYSYPAIGLPFAAFIQAFR